MKKGYIGYALLLIVLLASAGILTSSAALAAEKRVFSKSCSLDLLPVAKDFKRMRFSSFDTSGGNSDNIRIGHAETTEDLKFTAEYVACIGACGMAPVIMVGDDTYGSMTVQKMDEVIAKYQKMD